MPLWIASAALRFPILDAGNATSPCAFVMRTASLSAFAPPSAATSSAILRPLVAVSLAQMREVARLLRTVALCGASRSSLNATSDDGRHPPIFCFGGGFVSLSMVIETRRRRSLAYPPA